MLITGDIVDATLVRIEPYGLYFSAGEDTVLVTADNLSWRPSGNTMGQFALGQKVRLFIERFNYSDKVYAGNLKILTPEQNPYREFAALPPDKVLRGTVKMVHQNGVSVKLSELCSGELPITDETKILTVGSEVHVQITSLEVNDQRMTLKLAT